MKSPVTFQKTGSIGIIEIDSPPVNASSQAVRKGLIDALHRASAEPGVAVVLLRCAGKTFMAGADIAEFDQPAIPTPDPNDVFAALDASTVPVVAELHGSVLGGGLELALACDYRIAAATSTFGLPEVKLGVLPGAGGTQRLPRLIGIERALDMMTGGTPVDAARAQEFGLVDLVTTENLREAATTFALRVLHEPMPRRVVSRVPLDGTSLDASYFDGYRARLAPEHRGGRPAHEIVRCVEFALAHSFSEGLAFERKAFEACRASAESKALRHIFFAEREAARVPGLVQSDGVRPIASVGVVGAGTMGVGIAINFLAAGIPVTLVDISVESLQRGTDILRSTLSAAVQKGRLTAEQLEQQCALVTGSLEYADLETCDLVVEAAFENLDIKKSICARLGAVCKQGAIIATNTSSLDVDVLAEATGRAEDVLGMHFFSPAHVMKLLEVVRGAKTSTQVLATAMALAKRIKKTAVVSGVCFGFIGNRMLEGYLRETDFLLLEGASPLQIDRAMEAMGMAMGPCRMMDMAGVDVAAKVVLEQLKTTRSLADPAYRVVVQRLNALGRHGQKSSAGYYAYSGRSASEDPAVNAICRELAEQLGIRQRVNIPDEEIVARCLYPLINEGARILDEGIAYRSGDIDVVWVYGYGFPAYKGGPMHWAKTLGPGEICRRIAAFEEARGNAHGYWSVSPFLVRMAAGSLQTIP